MDDTSTIYGFTAVAADQLAERPDKPLPKAVAMTSLQPPTTPLATRVAAYVESKLDADTYRHSLRVYSFGLAIAREMFPQWAVTSGSTLEETWFLTAMLHDIGTCEEFLTSTRLSFEFWGGYHALEILQDASVGGDDGKGTDAAAPRQQAESVAEAIIRHQDVQDKGRITLITRLIHLGTLLDNIGAGADLVHPQTIKNVVQAYPRPGWSGCFQRTVGREKKVKPYAMVSRIEGFEDAIEQNGKEGGLMAAYD